MDDIKEFAEDVAYQFGYYCQNGGRLHITLKNEMEAKEEWQTRSQSIEKTQKIFIAIIASIFKTAEHLGLDAL